MRVTSPWGEASRKPLRVVIASVLVLDLASLVVWIHARAAGPWSSPDAPGVVLALGGTWALPSLVAGVGAAAAVRFARRPGALASGAVVLVAHGTLVEVLGVIRGMRWHVFFSVAATLTGWLAGLAIVRTRRMSATVDEAERFAEHGAAAGLAATYVAAFLSKLIASGSSWLAPSGLRALLVGQTGLVGTGFRVAYARILVSSSVLPPVLLAIVAAAQLGAVVYPFSARARFVVGTTLIGFHVNTLLLAPIFYFQATALLLAFSYPWPAIAARRRHRSA